MTTKQKLKIDYGIDAPGLVKVVFFISTIAWIIFTILLVFSTLNRLLTLVLLLTCLAIATYCLAMGLLMVVYSKFIKLKDREKLLDLVKWNGNEVVLDVGCGRGLMLIGAAKRISTGRAIGIDLWQQQDQSNNNAEGTRLNAKLEGVSHLVEVKTADMRYLPFPDKTFDVVTSSWAIHNLENQKDRQKSLDEIIRVLKPNGIAIVADIADRDKYQEHLRARGLTEIRSYNYVSGLCLLKCISFGSFVPSATYIQKTKA